MGHLLPRRLRFSMFEPYCCDIWRARVAGGETWRVQLRFWMQFAAGFGFAVAYATPLDEQSHLRPRNAGNQKQHAMFLNEFAVDSDDYREVIDWFRATCGELDLEWRLTKE